MKTLILAIVALGVIAAMPAPGASAGGSPDAYYVSLGDSLASGYQPVGGPQKTCLGASGYNQGYADQLFKIARSENTNLRLEKLGCGGETTESMITRTCDDFCPFPEGSQLAQAVAFLRSHPGQVEFLTIDLGGNDWLEGCDPADVPCTNSILPAIQANLTTIIEAVQAAAPGVPIYGMNYYNPFLASWLEGPDGHVFAQQSQQAVSALNAGLVSAYTANGVTAVDVAGAFDVSNFSDTVALKGVGTVPVNVANACMWTWACEGPPHGPDIHANSEGYRVIAEAFAEAVFP